VLEREQAVAVAGFGPAPQPESDGFISYPCLDARPMLAGDLSPRVLARLASYCAFRDATFPFSDADPAPLREMAEHNLRQLGFHLPLALKFERPVLADARMQPHEWLLTGHDEMLKTDSGSHGDDHFFPGPTDIAWDLAGAIVEWRMNAGQAREFLDLYCRISGDDAALRIAGFITAYAAFRCAYSKMAANAMAFDAAEHARLELAAESYADLLRHAVLHTPELTFARSLAAQEP